MYILFFSRAKQRPRTRVDPVVNGSKTHESNGNKISTTQKSGCVDKSVCNKQISNHLQETNKSTNGFRSFIQKSGCVEKPFSMKISANHSETNRSNNFPATNGTKTLACQRSDRVETPANSGDLSDNQPEMCNGTSLELNSCNSTYGQISSACLKLDVKESSDHHNQTSDSAKTDHELPSQQKTFSDSGSTSKVLAPGNMRIVIHKKDHREENGHIAASATSVEEERTGLMSDRNCMGKTSADIQSTKQGLSSLPLSNGNGSMTMDSPERSLPKVNGSAHSTDSQKSLNCQDLSNGNIGASNSSRVKRKIEDDCSCIFFSTDDQSRARVEAFKESYVTLLE